MASKYTYEDVLKLLGDNYMSDADRKLAQENPDAGMSLAQLKLDYASTTDNAARIAMHDQAEAIRKSYGSYSGGADGSEYLLYNPTPASTIPVSAPTYQSGYSDTVNELLKKQQNYGSFNYNTPAPTYQPTGAADELLKKQQNYGSFNYNTPAPTYQPTGAADELLKKQQNYGSFNYNTPAPTYQSNYSDAINGLMQKQLNYGGFTYDTPAPVYEAPNRSREMLDAIINNQKEFSYDANSDPSYQAYKKEYAREGQRAAADAIGAYASATGGIPSSYAQTAASQASNYYAAQMADKMPELYQAAYNRFLQENQRQLDNYNAVRAQETDDYNRYLNQLSQYNTDRNFAYGQYSDEYARILDALNAAQSAENANYNKYLDQLSQYNTDRNFAYGQYTDEYARLQDAISNARAQENDNYNRYLNQLSQYNTDRNFAYGQYTDEYGRLQDAISNARAQENDNYNKYLNQLSQYNTDRNFAYGQYSDEYARLQDALNAAQNAEKTDYNRYLDQLSQYNTDRNFAYNQLLDEITNRRNDEATKRETETADYEKLYNEAVLAAKYGDYSKLRAMGIEPDLTKSSEEYERVYNEAVLAAKYGDYSKLRELGINPDFTAINNEALASGGKYTASSGSSSGSSSGNGKGYNNEGLSYDQIVMLQSALGVDQDGKFGPESQKEARKLGYNSATEAYAALVENASTADGIPPDLVAMIKQQNTTARKNTDLNQVQWAYVRSFGYTDEQIRKAGFELV